MTIVALQALNVLLHKASVAREVLWVAALHCLVNFLRDNVQCDVRPENCPCMMDFPTHSAHVHSALYSDSKGS